MTASEKLRALHSATRYDAPTDRLTFTKGRNAEHTLLRALPALADVVEAAEKGPRFSSKDLDRGGNWEDSWMETEALDAAISALNEVLNKRAVT